MKRKICLGILLFLGLTLTLNTGIVFARENTNTTGKESTTYQLTSNNSTALVTSNSEDSNFDKTTNAAGTTETIKVLIYSGNYASTNCVNGIKRALDYANTNNVINGVVFSYATSTVINQAALAGYNLLAMPGGSGGAYYLDSGSISGSAIRNFVANGGGYLGICAGAYAAAAHTDGWYDGWGVAPHVRCKEVNYEGGLSLQITSAGQQVLGTSGTKTLAHYNGPAMYVSGNAVVFATYADGNTGYPGYAAIVGDYYGKGRVVLCGPHPELSPLVPTFVSQLINWASGDSSSSSTITVNQVATAASSVKSFYETNYRLPNYVTTSSGQLSMSQFLYVLTTGTTQANTGSTTPISIKTVTPPPNPTEQLKSGTIAKSEYINLAKTIKNFVDTNGRLPNYVTTSLGKMRYDSLVYMFSKIMNFYKTNGRLPSTVSVNGGEGTSTTTPVVDESGYTTVMLGETSYGFVQKLGPFGTGTNKVAVIIGVHPQEGQAHLAILNAIKALSFTLENIQLWVYQVRVYNATDYTISRNQGQNLASKFVVPDIDKSFKLVMDVHSNRGYYYNGKELQDNFVFAPSNRTQSLSFANKLIENTDFLKYYQVADGSSPQYVTIPLANKGIPAVIYEVYQNVDDYQQILYGYAIQVVKALNTIFS